VRASPRLSRFPKSPARLPPSPARLSKSPARLPTSPARLLAPPAAPRNTSLVAPLAAALAAALAVGACAEPGGFEGNVLPDGSDRGSMPAEVRQVMGSTEIRVIYNRPAARGRELFGALVPYDSIWNPGADEATRIELTDDVLVRGEPLDSGKYSLWAIPRPDRWTFVFSRAWDVFHVPYPEGQDALRLEVPVERGPHVESLQFAFPMAMRDSARLEMRWGNAVLRFPILPGGA